MFFNSYHFGTGDFPLALAKPSLGVARNIYSGTVYYNDSFIRSLDMPVQL